MSESSFEFLIKWDDAEKRRFLEVMRQKKIEFCREYGLPIPAFDKEEDFLVTTDMIAWAQGEEQLDMLSPCPFCGGNAQWGREKREDAVFIYCESCHCSTKSIPQMVKNGNGYESQPHKLIARRLWNARVGCL